MLKQGLFVGLITGDLLYSADRMPQANEKIVALAHCFTAGGPATNAAIAFQYCGARATLVGVLGQQPLGQLLRREIERYGVTLRDLLPQTEIEPPLSSVIVTQGTGDRAVISLNAKGLPPLTVTDGTSFCQGVDVVLIDGHQMQVGAAIAKAANAGHIPVVVDAGSWKAHFETVLSQATYIICSANFRPPRCHSQQDTVQFLQQFQPAGIAVTQGEQPILWWTGDRHGAIPIPLTQVVDTLGAGDIFHGAFCYYILQQDFISALQSAAHIASRSCQFFGTRTWMQS